MREALRFFAKAGQWPDPSSIQRRLDQDGGDIKVAEALWGAPRLMFDPTVYPPQQVAFPIRALRLLPEAKPVIDVAMVIVQAAVTAYFRDGDAAVYQNEPAIVDASGDNLELALRALDLIRIEPLGVWGGGNRGDNGFRIEVSQWAREYKGVETVDDYAAVQLRLLGALQKVPLAPEILGPAAAPVAAEPSQLLVYQLHPVLSDEPYELVVKGNPRLGLQEGWHQFRDWLYRNWPELNHKEAAELITAAYGDKGCIDLTTADMDTETRGNIQNGAKLLGLAIVPLIRNPTAHGRPWYAPDNMDERDYARGAMSLINTLCWWTQAALDRRNTGQS
jgi:hypothetical protein